MVFTVEEILEKSRRDANGVSFEEALKRSSKFVEIMKVIQIFCFQPSGSFIML